jgi:hypothetical protein
MTLLNGADATWGLYQLIFTGGALLAMYSAYAWYEGKRFKDTEAIRRARLLLLLAVVVMVATAFVSLAITRKLPY